MAFLFDPTGSSCSLVIKKNITLMLNPSHNLKDKRCIFPARAQGCDYGIAHLPRGRLSKLHIL